MREPKILVEGLSPVFVLVDDDREASQRIALVLPSDWFFVPVVNPGFAVRYAKRFQPTAVLLAEPVAYPRGGAARLLQDLLDDAGRPVIILSEDANPEAVERWRRMGASDCIPHPTRSFRRMNVLRRALQDSIARSEPHGILATMARLNEAPLREKA